MYAAAGAPPRQHESLKNDLTDGQLRCISHMKFCSPSLLIRNLFGYFNIIVFHKFGSHLLEFEPAPYLKLFAS